MSDKNKNPKSDHRERRDRSTDRSAMAPDLFAVMNGAAEWRQVGKDFDQLKEKMRDAMIDVDPSDPHYADLLTAVDFKAALEATCPEDAWGTRGKRLVIESADLSKGVFFMIERGGGVNEPVYTKLKGQISPAAAAAVGRVTGLEEVFDDKKTWGVVAKSGGDSNPYVHVDFQPFAEGSELGFEYFRSGDADRLEVIGRAPNEYMLPIDQVDSDMARANMALAAAVTDWITKPEPGTLTRGIIPAN